MCGRVFASEPSQDGNETLDEPLAGVKISVDGNADIATFTESDGTFVMVSFLGYARGDAGNNLTFNSSPSFSTERCASRYFLRAH